MKKATLEFLDASVEITQTNPESGAAALIGLSDHREIAVTWGEHLKIDQPSGGYFLNLDGNTLKIIIKQHGANFPST